MSFGGGGGGGDAGDDEAEEVKEKVIFDVIIKSYEASSKVKIIKAVRKIVPELSLKEVS